MASVSTDYKRLFLRGAKWDSESASPPISLYAQLKALAQAKLEQNDSGLVLVGTSQAGHSVTMALPQNGRGITPQIALELVSEMLDRWDAAVAYLELAVNYTATTSDTAIFNEMMARLKAARRVGMDCSNLRVGVGA